MIKSFFDELKHLFIHDDGSLPDIWFEGLSGDQVCAMYNWLRSQGGIYDEPLLWDTQEERDVRITADLPAAERMISGRYENFRHGLSHLEIKDVVIPQLTVAVTPNTICVDYRMGSEWGEQQVLALLEMLWILQQMAPKAKLQHAYEGLNPTESFQSAWSRFKQSKAKSS